MVDTDRFHGHTEGRTIEFGDVGPTRTRITTSAGVLVIPSGDSASVHVKGLSGEAYASMDAPALRIFSGQLALAAEVLERRAARKEVGS